MHRTLFLLSIIVPTYSVQAMDFKAVQTIHTKQIGTENAQFKNYAKEQRKQERSLNKQKHLLDYEFADMKGALKKTTNFTAECFMENDFEELVGKPSLPEAHLNLLQVPHPVLNAVQNYNDKSNPDNKNKAFHTLFVGLPGELRHQIMANLLEGNEEAEAIFNSKPYGQSMFNLAYALEEVKNNPIAMFTMDEQLGLAIESPEMHRLFLRINNIDKNGELPKLTLREEQFIVTQMPQAVLRRLPHGSRNTILFACQLSYGERIVPALKNGLSYGCAAASVMLLASLTNGITGLGNPITTAFNDTIMTKAPQNLHYASNHLCLMAPYAYTVAEYAAKLYAEEWKMKTFKIVFLGMLTEIGVGELINLKWGKTFNSNKITPILVAELIAGTLGGAYGIASSLHESTKSYPVKKTLGDIIHQHKK